MRTTFTASQLADPAIASSNGVLRTCVHCGFCLATCPTYVLDGDELDSPRGRIYQIKEMLEHGGAPTAQTVKHVDRCLSCLSCLTTCPSSVNYMHLVDHAREYIEDNYRRPLGDRLLRTLIATVLTRPWLMRISLWTAGLTRPLAKHLPGRLRRLVAMAPVRLPVASHSEKPGVFPAQGKAVKRVAMLPGCAQAVLGPGTNDAAVRVLNRHGVEVIVAPGGCCGALPHHLGKSHRAKTLARANIAAWMREIEGQGLDAIIVTTSGCGTTLKDYGFLLRDDPQWATPAACVAALCKDITEVLHEIGLQAPVRETGLIVAYHSACSLQHGQKVTTPPRHLLRAAGFKVLDVPEAHLCCGSAGTYNMLQPSFADRLKARKVANIESTNPDVIAAGNIGCISQIGSGTDIPIVHTIELIDWAGGGPLPMALADQEKSREKVS